MEVVENKIIWPKTILKQWIFHMSEAICKFIHFCYDKIYKTKCIAKTYAIFFFHNEKLCKAYFIWLSQKLERYEKNYILSQLADQVLFKWCVSPSVNIYREIFEMLLYGQITS